MLAALMGAVGLYYENQTGATGTTSLDAMVGTALDRPAESAEPPRSGVDLSALDKSTRPQDDFYQFANGGWLDRTEIPAIYSGYTVYHEVHERAEEALRRIIESSAAAPGEPGSESQQVGDIFTSWMDTSTIDELGIEPVRSLLEQIDRIESPDQLPALMARLYRTGIDVPYDFYVYPDLKMSTQYAVYFGQSGITMPNRDYYIDLGNENFSRARNALPGYVADMLVRAGMDRDAAAYAGQAVYELEAAIARAHWDSVTIRDPEKAYNPYPVDTLHALGGNLDWTTTREVLGIEGEDQLIVRQPSYFEGLDALIADVPLATWKHYLAFRVLDSSAEHLDEATAAIRFGYRNRVLNGQQEQEPRWKRGIAMVNAAVGEAVGKLYVARHFPPEAKAKMQELVGNVIATLDGDLRELEWMSPETRLKAREKLAKFTAKIGYPDEWRDYSTLRLAEGRWLDNRVAAREFEVRRQLAGTAWDFSLIHV